MTFGVIVLIVFGVLALLVLIGTLTGYVQWERREPPAGESARAALHGARRGLESFRVRADIKADGARLRRELDRELSKIERREGRS